MLFLYIENYIKGIIDTLIKRYGTSEPEELIKAKKNVDFAYEPLTNDVNGYYIYISEKRQIVRINENLDVLGRQLALFHELGHCIMMHKGKLLLNCSTTICNRKEEYEAELFAAYFFKLHNGIIRENINDFTIPIKNKELMMRFLP